MPKAPPTSGVSTRTSVSRKPNNCANKARICCGTWVDWCTVRFRLDGSNSAMMARPSSGTPVWRANTNSRCTTQCAFAATAAKLSPPMRCAIAKLLPRLGWINGLSACKAAAASTTGGHSSHAMSINAKASSATARLVATTSTTGWPCQWLWPSASGPWAALRCWGKVAKAVVQVWQMPAKSLACHTPRTPGSARAALRSGADQRAWAQGLRKKAACSIPGTRRSSV